MSSCKRIADIEPPPAKRIEPSAKTTCTTSWSSFASMSRRVLVSTDERISQCQAPLELFHRRRKIVETLLMVANRLQVEYPGIADPFINIIIFEMIFPNLLNSALLAGSTFYYLKMRCNTPGAGLRAGPLNYSSCRPAQSIVVSLEYLDRQLSDAFEGAQPQEMVNKIFQRLGEIHSANILILE